ncbi:MAG: MFS transporter [Chromatiaceae bacterium]
MNIGHFLDHFFVLIFATAALHLTTVWDMSYAELIPYATPGFIAFAIGAVPAGWLADKWSREGMMAIFFLGIGVCSTLAGMANTPLQLAFFLTLVGTFAAIYHPVGLAMVVEQRDKTGVPIAVNGIFGNMGVASAALLTGVLMDTAGWRSAFIVPGAISIAVGLLYLLFLYTNPTENRSTAAGSIKTTQAVKLPRHLLLRIFGIILFTSAVGGLVFQSTTFSLPKVFDEQLADIAGNTTSIGSYAFLAFAVASFAQLVVGHLLDRQSVRSVFAVVAALQATFFLAMTQLDGIAALPVAIAFMLFVFGQIPINDVLIAQFAHSDWRSRAYALRSIVSFSVMASALPLVAWVHGTWGFNMLFGSLSVAATLIFLAALLLPTAEERVPAPSVA